MKKLSQWNRPTKQLQRFFNYALQHGLELLQDDKNWIASVCKDKKEEAIRCLLSPYIATWKAGMIAELLDHKKQNAGRYQANTELRERL